LSFIGWFLLKKIIYYFWGKTKALLKLWLSHKIWHSSKLFADHAQFWSCIFVKFDSFWYCTRTLMAVVNLCGLVSYPPLNTPRSRESEPWMGMTCINYLLMWQGPWEWEARINLWQRKIKGKGIKISFFWLQGDQSIWNEQYSII